MAGNSLPISESGEVTEARKNLALEFLELTRDGLEEAKDLRLRRILLARKYGLSNRVIGEALGITEAAVRGLVARGAR